MYAHFVAGADTAGIAPRLEALRQSGVGGILDYAAEADLTEEAVQYDEHAAAPGVNQPSRVYPYLSEASCGAILLHPSPSLSHSLSPSVSRDKHTRTEPHAFTNLSTLRSGRR